MKRRKILSAAALGLGGVAISPNLHSAAGQSAVQQIENNSVGEISLSMAKEILDRRDRSFMRQDIDAYLDIWSDNCIVELPSATLTGKTQLKLAIKAAWALREPLLLETRNFAVNGNVIFQETAIVWRNRLTDKRTWETGMSLCECGADGRWTWLRDYFDPKGRKSALDSNAVTTALGMK